MCVCMLNEAQCRKVRETVREAVQAEADFSGMNIAEHADMLDYRVGVSHFVRELFNRRDAVFAGYACYPHPDGYLLFFPYQEPEAETGEPTLWERIRSIFKR